MSDQWLGVDIDLSLLFFLSFLTYILYIQTESLSFFFFKPFRTLLVIAAWSLSLAQLCTTEIMLRFVNVEGRCELSHVEWVAKGDRGFHRSAAHTPFSLASYNTEICLSVCLPDKLALNKTSRQKEYTRSITD